MKKKISKVLSVMCSVATLATLFSINSASAMDEPKGAAVADSEKSSRSGTHRKKRDVLWSKLFKKFKKNIQM